MFGFNNHDITGIWKNVFCREVENGIGMQGVRIIESGKIETVNKWIHTTITDLKRYF